jgi:hypothetical protein
MLAAYTDGRLCVRCWSVESVFEWWFGVGVVKGWEVRLWVVLEARVFTVLLVGSCDLAATSAEVARSAGDQSQAVVEEV